jgi:hypothetical protein
MNKMNATVNPALDAIAPTHRCIECGATWRFWRKEETGQKTDSWSLSSRTCGKCCDMAPMGKQIEPITWAQLFAANPLTTKPVDVQKAPEVKRNMNLAILEIDELITAWQGLAGNSVDTVNRRLAARAALEGKIASLATGAPEKKVDSFAAAPVETKTITNLLVTKAQERLALALRDVALEAGVEVNAWHEFKTQVRVEPKGYVTTAAMSLIPTKDA